MSEKSYKSLHDFIEVDSAVDSFLSALDQSSIISISDVNANILWINHNFEKTFKCEQHSVIGKNYNIFSSKTHPVEFYKSFWQILLSGRNWRGIFCNKDLEENTIWLQTYIIPIKDNDQMIKYFISVRQDITYLMEKKASLEMRVKEELDSKHEFLSRLSHEIKTPLNAILGMVEILEMSELNTEQKDCIDTIFNSSQRLLQMINKTIEYNKVESDQFKIVKESFNLEKMLQSLKDNFLTSATQKNLKFKIESKLTQKFYNSDAKRIYQVLSYLIENAIKFTIEGSVKLTIKESEEKDFIIFEVRDSGVGLTEEIENSIFKQILQSDDFNGFGLSLAIAKKIADKMNGEIGCKTSQGVGSFFWFKIPLEISEQESKIVELDKININENDLKVLIVEDDLINQRLLKKLLNKLEIYPETANNGHEALALLKEQGFNVIFMDVNMPVMDGITATKKIRSNSVVYGKPVIIAVTANSVTGDEDNCVKAGMDDYIAKPINREALEKIVFGLQGKLKYISNFKPKSNLKFYIQKLNEDFKGDEEILASFARNVIDNAPIKLARIEKFINENDFKQIYVEANSFKDLISCLHHEELRRLVEFIESYGKDGKQKNISPLVNDVREKLYEMCVELEEYFFKEAA